MKDLNFSSLALRISRPVFFLHAIQASLWAFWSPHSRHVAERAGSPCCCWDLWNHSPHKMRPLHRVGSIPLPQSSAQLERWLGIARHPKSGAVREQIGHSSRSCPCSWRLPGYHSPVDTPPEYWMMKVQIWIVLPRTMMNYVRNHDELWLIPETVAVCPCLQFGCSSSETDRDDWLEKQFDYSILSYYYHKIYWDCRSLVLSWFATTGQKAASSAWYTAPDRS